MSDTNPYSLEGQRAAAHAAPDARAAFLQRTYGWLAIGVIAWCLTMAGVANVPILEGMARAMHSNWLITIIVLMAGGFAVRACAAKRLIGPVVYLGYALIFGLLVGPLVHYANAYHEGVVTEAAITTGVIFTALTAYVFISGKDFSFMGGALAILGGALLATLFVGWLFGFQFGIWMSIVIAMLYSAYILYDTSQILHHYPTNMHIAAAANLFANVVLLFYQLVMIFMSRDD